LKRGNIVRWQYRTILFEFQKDGILGDKYIDDDEMEDVLNEHGQKGWELVSVTPVQEGLLSFFKREIQQVRRPVAARPGEPVETRVQERTQSGAVSQKPLPRPKTVPAAVQNKVDKSNLKPDVVGGTKIS
jgi:hypothetical protein